MYSNHFSVSIISDGQVLREVDKIVKLSFGKEYQIRLINHFTSKALVDVLVDGKTVLSDKHIILYPNQTLDLEGFLEKNNHVKHRFKFIEKTEKIKDYRGDRIDDGIVEVKFRFERLELEWKSPTKSSDQIIWESTSDPCDHFIAYNTSISCNDLGAKLKSSNREGITGKGNQSSQNFTHGSIGSTGVENVIRLKIIGDIKGEVISMPIFTKTKVKCDLCGTLNKSNHKYCKECGNGIW